MKKFISACKFLVSYGPKNFIFRVSNRFRTWEFKDSGVTFAHGTSITDSNDHVAYLSFCAEVKASSSDFMTFRRNKSIISVYDHVPLEMGVKYFSEIESFCRDFGSVVDWKKISNFDSIGSPLKYSFKKIGEFSPTFLRYTKTLLEFESIFDSQMFKNICEIGVGFGGQGALILDRWDLGNYTFYDLPEVLHLVEIYLRRVDSSFESKITLSDGRNPNPSSFDFVFSNYAFSELDRKTQDMYLKNVILNSRNGYITWNNLGNYYNDAYSLADLIRIIPNSQILPESPLTSKFNSVIIW